MSGKRILIVIGAVIAVVAAGGGLADVGIAGATSQPVTYYGCLSHIGGLIYDVNEASTPTCPGKDLAISWAQVGPPGANGTNGNTILNGTALPTAGTGVNGDFYLDTVTHTLFGPKANGQWPSSGTSLVGPAGSSGNTILNGTLPPTAGTGNNGDFYVDTVLHTLYGPKSAGAWPAMGTSLIGPTGPSGAGASVATAAPGTNCSTGGLAVTAGSGAVSYVCNGATGATGAPGAGATAVAEPAGPNCATGGIKVTDGSGNVTYVCNGAPGPDATPDAIYAWMIQSTQVWVMGVENCWIEYGSFANCNAGSNGVPVDATDLLGGEIASIAVSTGGVITLTPSSSTPGISPSDTYILTPTAAASTPRIAQDIGWTASGGAVAAGLAPAGYVHPAGSINNPAADAFPWVADTTQVYVEAVENCFVDMGSLTGCGSGENGVPAAATDLLGGEVASITVSAAGVVTLTTGTTVFGATYTYILTPTVMGASSPLIPQDITWTDSGTAVAAGLAPFGYVHPAGSIANPAAGAFPWVANTTQVYVDDVENCFVETGSLTNCASGQHGVPAAATDLLGGEVASIAVSAAGVVTLTTGTEVFGANYTYILTPTVTGASSPLIPQDITWTASGTSVSAGLATSAYAHPAGSIENAPADAFAWISEGTQTFETAVEDCYVSTGSLTNCANGQNGVPAAYIGSGGPIASIAVSGGGVVTLVPAPSQGISAGDTYIRTPTAHPPSSGPDLPQDITWSTSGGACVDGLVVCG
jgi:hypothetical protein